MKNHKADAFDLIVDLNDAIEDFDTFTFDEQELIQRLSIADFCSKKDFEKLEAIKAKYVN